MLRRWGNTRWQSSVDGTDCDCWDERLNVLDARQRYLEVVDVRLYRSLAGVLQRPNAVELAPSEAWGCGPLRSKVLREVLALSVADRARNCPGPCLYPGQTLAQIRREARLRLLAIRNDVDAVLSLLLHRLRDSACQALKQRLFVVRLAGLLGAEHLAQVRWH
jgi:hypothetical protein